MKIISKLPFLMSLDYLDFYRDDIWELVFGRFSLFHRVLRFCLDLIFRTTNHRWCCNHKTKNKYTIQLWRFFIKAITSIFVCRNIKFKTKQTQFTERRGLLIKFVQRKILRCAKSTVLWAMNQRRHHGQNLQSWYYSYDANSHIVYIYKFYCLHAAAIGYLAIL